MFVLFYCLRYFVLLFALFSLPVVFVLFALFYALESKKEKASLCRTDLFLKHHSLILPRTKPFILLDEEVQDIDTESDWIIAEAKYRALKGV